MRRPSRNSTFAVDSPKLNSVAIAVKGNTPVGSTSSPTSALISVDLPRLNSPTTEITNRPRRQPFSDPSRPASPRPSRRDVGQRFPHRRQPLDLTQQLRSLRPTVTSE